MSNKQLEEMPKERGRDMCLDPVEESAEDSETLDDGILSRLQGDDSLGNEVAKSVVRHLVVGRAVDYPEALLDQGASPTYTVDVFNNLKSEKPTYQRVNARRDEVI